jgi:hypothetical protein
VAGVVIYNIGDLHLYVNHQNGFCSEYPVPETNWDKPLERAIGDVKTLLDAYQVLLKLPKAKQKEPMVQAAAEALLMAAEGRGPMHTAQAAAAYAVHGPRQDIQPKKPKLKIGKRLAT